MLRGESKRARWFVVLLATALLTSAGPALAQEDSLDDLARRHFESGVAYLQESDYENALQAFEKAYELSKRPAILLNIATVNERKADLKAAVSALETYLQVAPADVERGPIEARLANLKKRIDEGAAPNTVPKEPAADGTEPTAVPTTPDTGASPAPNNVPAYVLLGIGGLTAVGAGVTGLIAKGKYDTAKDECSPNCSDDDVSAGKTMAMTSTILTGVALVSAGIGAVLLFSNAPSNEKAARKPPPRFDVGFGVLPGSAAASARFRF